MNIIKSSLQFLTIFVLVNAKCIAAPTADDINGRLNLDVPQSAGFAILGLTPDTVIDPSNGGTFVAALLQGLDQAGNLQSGIAVEYSPYEYVLKKKARENETWMERSAGEKILAGIKFSLATAAGLESEDEAKRYSVGLNWSLRLNDPLNDYFRKGISSKYRECVEKKRDEVFPIVPTSTQGISDEVNPLLIEAANAISTQCWDKHVGWAVTAVSFGAAWTKAEPENDFQGESGFGAWATLSKAFGKNAELVLHARIVRDRLAVIESNYQVSDDEIYGARFRYGSSRFRLVAESSYNREKVDNNKRSFGLYSVGAETKLASQLWFRIAYGDVIGANSEREDVFSGQLRFGFGASPLSTL